MRKKLEYHWFISMLGGLLIFFIISFVLLLQSMYDGNDQDTDHALSIKNNKHREHLTIYADRPIDLPHIQLGKNVFEADAFSLMSNKKNRMIIDPHIIYVKASSRDTYKMLMFLNFNAWNMMKPSTDMNTNSKIVFNIVALDPNAANLASILLDLQHPNSDKIEFDVKSTDKEGFIRSGIDSWKADELQLFCLIMNENDDEMKRLAQIMSTWSLVVFDYFKHIDKKKVATIMPYAHLSGFRMRSFLSEKSELDHIFSVLSFDLLVYVKNGGSIMQARKHVRDEIILNLQRFYSRTSTEPENDMHSITMYEKLLKHHS